MRRLPIAIVLIVGSVLSEVGGTLRTERRGRIMPSGLPRSYSSSDQFSERSWLTALLDEIPISIGIFDPSGHLCHANRRFAESKARTARVEPEEDQAWNAFAFDGDFLGSNVSAYVGHLALPNLLSEPEPGPEDTFIARSANGTIAMRSVGETQVSSNVDAKVEARFRCFAEHSSNAIMIADARTGKIEYLSPAAERIWSDHAPIKTIEHWEDSIHPDDRPFALESRGLVRQGLYQRFQYRIIDRHGQTARHVRETSFPMPSESGELECIGGIVEDISPEMPVYLVRTSPAAHSAVQAGLLSTPYRVTTFSSHAELMNVAEVLNPGCVIIDLIDATPAPASLLKILSLRPAELQIILVGSQDTPSCDVIDALKAGAADYLIYPFTGESLANALHRASQALANSLTPKTDRSLELRQRLASLPIREREVFLGLVGGGTNKSIARTLKLSPRTVEVHRAHLMQRLNVRTLTALLHFARDAGIKG